MALVLDFSKYARYQAQLNIHSVNLSWHLIGSKNCYDEKTRYLWINQNLKLHVTLVTCNISRCTVAIR